MWCLLTSVLSLQLAVWGVTLAAESPEPLVTAPALATQQEPPPPPPNLKEDSQEGPAKGRGERPGQRRAGGRRASQRVTPEDIQLPTGPMRIELSSLGEERIRYEGEAPENAPEPSLRLRVKLTGERLGEMVGLGHLVVSEAIDDTGAVLASPKDIEARDREDTSPVRISPRVLQRGYVDRVAQTKVPSRAARRLTKVSGWVNVVYGDETEDILIDNPLQYTGTYVQHPRLQELGIQVRVIEPGSEINVRRDGRGIGLRFESGEKKVRRTSFFDAWLKPLYPKGRLVKAADDQEYVYYGAIVGEVDADTQMLLTVYPEIEEERVLFEFKDVELP